MSRFANALDGWQGVEGLPSAFAAARDAVDAMLRDRGLRRTGPDVAAAALARGAEASAHLESAVAGDGGQVAQAALRLNAELLALVPVVGRSPAQALARMHALTGLGEPETLGRPRLDGRVADAVQEFGRDLIDSSGSPALVVGALAHAEVAALAPFATANGLVARALERLILVARGVDPASSLVPEAGYLARRDGYLRALDAYAAGGTSGAAHWLSFAADAAIAATDASPLAQQP
ncbi:MAG TPA: hypothetical protein VHS35_08010 [Pseudonocardia sp.]|jgi:hypothetical protein|nr:hypothetical protein [Pseudonocardia sp.]